MAINSNNNNVGYSLNQPLTIMAPMPIVGRRAPTVNDINYQIGQEWVFPASNAVYFLTSVVSNSASWTLSSSGGAGVFSSLTVTPGPISLTGTTSINTSGAAATSIGTGGTGAVNIGNTTGNTAVTGTLTTSAGITATTGNIVASAGNLTATLGNIAASAGSVTAATSVTGATLYASGDLGGVVAQNALSNVSVAVAGGSGVFSITSTTGAGAGTNAGFIKMYVGATAVFIPYYTATT